MMVALASAWAISASARRFWHLEMTPRSPPTCCPIGLAPCSLAFNSAKRDWRGGIILCLRRLPILSVLWTLLQSARATVSYSLISLHWRRRLGCSQPGHHCTVAWCVHLFLFHWSCLSWRLVPTSFHWMSSVPVRSNDTKSDSPNSRFHNLHSTTTATCRRGNVLSNENRQMPPWVLGG